MSLFHLFSFLFFLISFAACWQLALWTTWAWFYTELLITFSILCRFYLLYNSLSLGGVLQTLLLVEVILTNKSKPSKRFALRLV